MKKIKILIIILVSLILILGVIFIINRYKIKDEISNYIEFESANYETIENIVFYSKDLDIDDELKNNLTIIADSLKVKYPNKSILYLRDLGSASLFDAKEIYRCIQIINGKKIEGTDMNVLIREDESINVEFVIGCSWKNESDTDNIKISQKQAEDITINYLVENQDDYNELRSGIMPTNSESCIAELYEYNGKTAWKMQFSTGSSYIIIDANTGEILDTYFFCGVYVD